MAQGSSCARLSCHPCMQLASLFDFELSIPSNFLFFSFSFNLLQSLLHFFHNLEGSSNTAYSAKKEMESYDESYLPTGYEPKNYDLMETYVESLTESLTQPQFSEQRFLEDVDYDDTALEEMLRERTPSTCLSLPARRLVCRSVVVRVRANGETRCGENRETCCGSKWSGAKR